MAEVKKADDMPPSSGKTVAVAGLSTGQAVVLLLYVVHKFGIDDMTPEVAVSIISLAVGLAAAIMHHCQRATERKNEGPAHEFT